MLHIQLAKGRGGKKTMGASERGSGPAQEYVKGYQHQELEKQGTPGRPTLPERQNIDAVDKRGQVSIGSTRFSSDSSDGTHNA